MKGRNKFEPILSVAIPPAVGLTAVWHMQRAALPSQSWATAIPVYAIETIATYWIIQRAAMMLLGM